MGRRNDEEVEMSRYIHSYRSLTNYLIGFFDDERAIGLQFSTDGVQLFRGAKKEVWPFLILNLNLPPQERYI
jgi:hypothetical protein